MGSRTVGADRFAREIEDIVGAIEPAIARQMPQALSESLQLGKRHVVSNASALVAGTGRYLRGWSARRDPASGGLWEGHVYNRDVPGLPHLLEKGHAKVGGGRVAGREHIAPAADDTFRDFERRVGKAVDRAL